MSLLLSSCSCSSSPPSLVGAIQTQPCAPWGCGSSWVRATSCSPSSGSCSSCLPCSWTLTCLHSLTSTCSSSFLLPSCPCHHCPSSHLAYRDLHVHLHRPSLACPR